VDVTVQERKISFTSEYDITANGKTYYARKTVLAINDHLEIKDEHGHVAATIQGLFSLIRGKHDFILADGRTYHFQTERFWKPSYSCVGSDETYTLYQHKGLKCSIFRGDRQVAAFDKNSVVFGGGNEYDIRMDSDANLMVIVCMVLTINTADYDGDQQDLISVNWGNIGPEARAFDECWEPR
jgi:uncharacterized protein YxjI